MVALLHPEPTNPNGLSDAFASRMTVSPPRSADGARSRTDHRGRADLVLVVDNGRPRVASPDAMFGWLVPMRNVLEIPVSSFGARSSVLAGVNLSVGAVAGLVVSLLVLFAMAGPAASALYGAGRVEPAESQAGFAGAQAQVILSELNPGEVVVVAVAGDSLWSIALERFPEHDPRSVVAALAARNGSDQVAVGQPIVVPTGLLG